ncbi:MAG: methyl-accepting chemotaxis protein [Microcystis aeruginosa DA14]|uniref:Methyl-accepting chemotaxis protein n=1 Tax=Microcystis aeruginosa DA14 TaxID=1987506 RepID=A0A3E0MDH9_MICAE|nr:MAG: methyl-accepting chemotaxis protein [Microcystis aeruginosa DA14]
MPSLMPKLKIRGKAVVLAVMLIAMTSLALTSLAWVQMQQQNDKTAMSQARTSLRTLAVLLSRSAEGIDFTIEADRLATVRAAAMPTFAEHALVDLNVQAGGGVATIFVTDDRGAFIRRSTNLKKENGERAIGTSLAADHPAQASLRQAKPYYGPANLFGRPYLTAYQPVLNTEGSVIGVLFIGIPTEELAAAARQTLFALIVALLGIATVFGLAAAVIVQRATRPLSAATASLNRVADGDLDTPVVVSDRADEIGDLSRALAVFRDNALQARRIAAEQAEDRTAKENRAIVLASAVEEFDRTVVDVVSAVTSASTQLEAAAQTLATTAEATQGRSGTVAAASEQASGNVQAVAAATDEMTSSVEEISRQVQHSMQKANAAVAEAKTTDLKVTELLDAASKIGEVVKLITAVAEQTNLLALNATIEAARAGEAGKGFAVVASEVKALAGQTARATEAIGTQIQAMQGATREAAASIQAIGATIVDVADIATAIAAAVEEQGAATREIARNVQEAARGTVEVSSSIVAVNEGAVATGQSAGQVLDASGELSFQAERLKRQVDSFLATVRHA